MAITTKTVLGGVAACLIAACSTTPIAPVPAVDDPDRSLITTAKGDAIGDELLVRFRDGVSLESARERVARMGGRIVGQGEHTGYYVVRFDGTQKTAGAVGKLQDDDQVVEATFNHLTRGQGVGTSPSSPLQQYQWYFTAMGADPWIGLPRADGVMIAVLDTGVAYEDFVDASGTYALAPDLAGVDFAPGHDFINDDDHPNDDQRHGTHVAGVIAASRGVTPVARGATILPVKVLGGDNVGTELALAEGIRFAVDQGADVINMSLSFPPGYFPSRMLGDAIEYASQHGVVLVAAAGNQGLETVTYPAAFRDVISVGATSLPADSRDDFRRLLRTVERAPYSNHSYKIDVVAPSGVIEGDLDHNGFPEAVLAQSFTTGDPTDFEYVFYAGTSQATALVSGVVAVMKAWRPSLTPYEIRALLTETARGDSRAGFLSDETGRGMMQAYLAIASTWFSRNDRPRYLAQVSITLHDRPSRGVYGRAHVEILDQNGRPARDVDVYGQWSGAATGMVHGRTNREGLLEVDSPQLGQPHVVAFQVDAVRAQQAFDRPRGFFRIDARSLDMLSQFGLLVDGVGTSPSGSGVGTSPSAPLTLAFDRALFEGTRYRDTLLMPNFSWGMATVPMAVAVDEAWYLSQFPTATDRRVRSHGRGWGRSPLRFDAASFPIAVPTGSGTTVSLIVLTYTSGVGTSPSGVGTSPSGVGTSPSIWVDRTYGDTTRREADAYDALLAEWYAAGEVSPSLAASPLAAAGTLAQAVSSYFEFAPLDIAEPVGSYGATLEAAGRSVAPATRP